MFYLIDMKKILTSSLKLLAFTLLAFAIPAQAQVNLTDGLEVHWAFDRGNGNVAADSSGNEREAVPAEDIFPGALIDWSGGKFGGSVLFDTTYMLHSPFEYFGIGGAEPRTVSFWIKTEWDAANSSAIGALIGWGINAPRQRIHVKLNGKTDADGNVLQNIRTENQGGNNWSDLYPVNDGVWHHIISVFDPTVDSNGDGILAAVGDFDQYVDLQLESKNGGVGNPVETNINPDEGAVPLTIGGGYFPNINAARTSEARLDDFRLYSRALSLEEIQALFDGQGVDGPPSVEITNNIEGEELLDAATPIEFSIRPQGDSTVNRDDVTLTLNGKNIIAEATITGSDTEWTGTYTGLEENKVYNGSIGATDSQGRTYSFEFSFDTISENNFTIEAEDFNFGGGGFFDNPIICADIGGATDLCYFDRISTQGVDANDSNADNADDNDFLANAYRYGAGFDREEQVDTWQADEKLRSKFTEFAEFDLTFDDFQVDRVNTGEWYNYTRTIEAGTYQILLRARARAEQDLSIGLVDSPVSSNQNVTSLGSFDIQSTGGSYKFFQLTDENGRIAVVELGGEQTLRITAENADENVDLNYLMLLPAEPVTSLPPATLTAASATGQITLSWDVAGGTLQSSDNVTGPWNDVSSNGTSHTKEADQATEFFRVISQ